jgi:membrane-bound acyltransferase YfiQ involved in biofilm formation
MVSIIAVHCADEFAFTKASPTHLGIAIITMFKFGTIGFFLVSGFLLGERVDRRDPVEYFMRRLNKIFLPWLFWLGILCALLSVHKLIDHGFRHADPVQIVRLALGLAWSCLVESPFWFVPNLLLCIAILLACRRYLYTLKLGAILFAANLVYVVNIYALWFQPRHTQALFAFVFYLWLGSYTANNFARINQVLARIPVVLFVTLAICTGVASYCESALLATHNNPTPFNTLRLSNQAFSICVALVFFKLRRATWPRIIDVRRDTFGLYLTHAIVLLILMRIVKCFHHSMVGPVYLLNVESVLLWIALFLLTYLSSLIVTKWLATRPSLHWTVGLTTQQSTSLAADNVSPELHLSLSQTNHKNSAATRPLQENQLIA